MLPNLTVNQVYRQYDKKISDNTFLLAQQNAGNIEYLKERVNTIQDMADEVNKLSSNVDALQEQMNGLIQANAQYTSQNLGTTPPQISGAVEDTTAPSSTDFITAD
jgi:methyl-accepting chemotaxis protein